jgi:hypothetical protein
VAAGASTPPPVLGAMVEYKTSNSCYVVLSLTSKDSRSFSNCHKAVDQSTYYSMYDITNVDFVVTL